MTNALPDGVRRFLLRHVRRIEDLDVLAVLWRSRRPWRAAEITSQLRTSEMSVRATLDQLRSSEIVGSDGSEYWLNDSGEQQVLLAEVMELWRTHKSRVIAFVYSRPARS